MASSTHPEVELISRSNFAFSNSLHEQLDINGEGGNLVFSPFSLGLVLLMTRFGARGRTAEQLDRVLNPTIANTSVLLDDLVPMRRGFFKVLKSIKTDRSSDYNVTVANRMFTGAGFNVKEEFKKISRATLDIKVKQLDFTEGGGGAAAEAINSWVANKTEGKINGIVSSDSLNNQSQAVLVNGIHFKSPWAKPFDPQDTRRTNFHLNSFSKVKVDMMTKEDQYAHGDLPELNAHAVVLPYEGNRFSMHVYVPKVRDGLDDLLRLLKSTSMDQIRNNIQESGNCEKVRLSLPRFKIQSELKLLEPLMRLGAEDMFSANLADFSGISDEATVYISDVVQKAYIMVDEEGTEAAAASGIQAGVTCIPSITTVKADRPFYFQIVDEPNDIVLFAGTVRNPSAAVEATVSPTVPTANQRESQSATPSAHPTLRSPSSTVSNPPSEAVRVLERTSGDPDSKIIFVTSGEGVKAYLEGTESARTVRWSNELLTGVTWDPTNQQLYYSGFYKIYRTNIEGANLTVHRVTQYGAIRGLAFDEIGGKLYAATLAGHILACARTRGDSLDCASVIKGDGRFQGVAVDSKNGVMYWTDHLHGLIRKAALNGFRRGVVIDRLASPTGIAIDHSSSRLIWAEDYKVRSCNFDGSNVQTNVQLSWGSRPWGVAVRNGTLFWSSARGKMIQRSDMDGSNVQTLYTGLQDILHLTVTDMRISSFSRRDIIN